MPHRLAGQEVTVCPDESRKPAFGRAEACSGRNVCTSLFFFPRGGSAQVARALCRSLISVGWRPTLVAGSLGACGQATNAATFFAGIDVFPVEYVAATTLGEAVVAGATFQPSYEDRPGAPDPVFASVGDEDYERLVAAWSNALVSAGAAGADVLHLHHLTPAHEAALRSFPKLPIVGQLHGTELAMLREIKGGQREGWTHAAAWATRLRRWAQACTSLIVSPGSEAEVESLLRVSPERLAAIPSGVDLELFHPRPLAAGERLSFWRRWLVDEPHGWDESGLPGSLGYGPDDLWPFEKAETVFVFVGRYTAVKRIPLLLAAHKRAQERFRAPAPLVIVGGHPGEWEGRHPLAVIRELGNNQAFLAGWREHHELPPVMNAADLLVLPSVAEAFGLVLVEAMACGLPVIAVDAYGPARIVAPETGWLIPPHDETALADALVSASDRTERQRRGAGALAHVRRLYSWQGVAKQVTGVYDKAIAEGSPPSRR